MNATTHGPAFPAFQTLGEQLDAVSDRVTEILSQLDEQEQQIAALKRDQHERALYALQNLLADYRRAADEGLDWFWVDQIEDRITAFLQVSGRGGSQ